MKSLYDLTLVKHIANQFGDIVTLKYGENPSIPTLNSLQATLTRNGITRQIHSEHNFKPVSNHDRYGNELISHGFIPIPTC